MEGGSTIWKLGEHYKVKALYSIFRGHYHDQTCRMGLVASRLWSGFCAGLNLLALAINTFSAFHNGTDFWSCALCPMPVWETALNWLSQAYRNSAIWAHSFWWGDLKQRGQFLCRTVETLSNKYSYYLLWNLLPACVNNGLSASETRTKGCCS